MNLSLRAPRGGSASVHHHVKKRTHAADHDDQAAPPKAPRGRPRTRYHPAPGHAGISRRQAQEWKANTLIVHHEALRTSSPDARATSRAIHLVPEPPSCHECPPFWTTGPGFDPLRHALDSDKEIVHSAPVVPCSQTEAHRDGTHHVCASCRTRAEKHKAKHFNHLGQQLKSLPLCDGCVLDRAALVANPEHVENGEIKRFGCTCKTDWMCFECSLNDMQTAKINHDVELEMRRGPADVEVVNGVNTVWIRIHCICGERLDGTERAWRCTCCHGIGIMTENPTRRRDRWHRVSLATYGQYGCGMAG